MSMHRLFLFTLLASFGFMGAAQAAPAMATGQVQDSAGHPLGHVYIRQPGGTTSAFSDDQGRFRLELDPKAGSTILFSQLGYQSVQQEVMGPELRVVLALSPTLHPPTPPGAAASALPDLLGPAFGLRYALRSLGTAYAGNSVSGWVNNELGLDWQGRWAPWLWTLGASRYRAPAVLPALSPDGSATFAPEVVEGQVALGYVLKLGSCEVAPQLTALVRDVHANTNGSAYSGTPLDWDQNRQALGLGGTVVGRFLSCMVGQGTITYFLPFSTWNTLVRAPYQLSGLQGLRIKAGVGHDLAPGLRLGLDVSQDLWGATGYLESSTCWVLSLSSRPAEVTP